MVETFENLANILRDWAKDKVCVSRFALCPLIHLFCRLVQKRLVEALIRYEKQEEERKSCFFFKKMTQKIYSSSLSRPNQQNVYEVNWFKKFNFS